jgi:putative FmdB family regulatory protein
MRYDYQCQECETVFETSHGMKEKPKVPCPKCKSLKTAIAFRTLPTSYIKGNGYLDKAGCHRDMNLWQLRNNDPYGKMRQRGEKEDLIQKLKRGGKHQKNPKHFIVPSTKK